MATQADYAINSGPPPHPAGGGRSRAAAALQSGAAGVRGLLRRVSDTYGQPGEDIKVRPFAPGSVSTAAGAMKLATAIFGAVRQQANDRYLRDQAARQAERDQLSIDRTRQEIAASTPSYNVDVNGTNVPMTRSDYVHHLERQPREVPWNQDAADLSGGDIPAGSYPQGELSGMISLSNRRRTERGLSDRARSRAQRQGALVATAGAVDKQLQAKAGAELDSVMPWYRGRVNTWVRDLDSKDPKARADAVKALGIRPEYYQADKIYKDRGKALTSRAAMVAEAASGVTSAFRARQVTAIEKKYQPMRDQLSRMLLSSIQADDPSDLFGSTDELADPQDQNAGAVAPATSGRTPAPAGPSPGVVQLSKQIDAILKGAR